MALALAFIQAAVACDGPVEECQSLSFLQMALESKEQVKSEDPGCPTPQGISEALARMTQEGPTLPEALKTCYLPAQWTNLDVFE